MLVPDPKVEDGINAAHMMSKRVWFDEARCAQGFEAFRQHRVDYDGEIEGVQKDGERRWDIRRG